MSKKDDLLPKVDKNGNVIPLAEASMVKFRRPFQHKLARYPAHVRGGVPVPAGVVLPRDCQVLGPVPEDTEMPAENPADEIIAAAKAEAKKLMEEAQANIEKMYAEAADKAKAEAEAKAKADASVKL